MSTQQQPHDAQDEAEQQDDQPPKMPSDPQDDQPPDDSIGGALREQPSVAAQAGVIAPLIGIVLLIILGLTGNVWIGVAVGFAATLISLPIILRILARRR